MVPRNSYPIVAAVYTVVPVWLAGAYHTDAAVEGRHYCIRCCTVARKMTHIIRTRILLEHISEATFLSRT